MLQAAPPPAVAPAPVSGVDVNADARVTLRCRVHADGSLSECRVLSQQPPGRALGDAALELATKFRMKPRMVDGRLVTEGIVTIPIRFRLGDVPPPESKEPPPPS